MITKLLSTFGFIFLISLMACNTKNGQAQTSKDHKYTNALVNESSPYLLQHAHNPVHWFPWKEEALKKAKDENKMIIISVGYSSCHWCHVMEHESFEDTTIARIMNENFVCIKVDREERPDVDDVYMTACHLSGGGGCGWPLNAFALPDGRPFFAGTYYPKSQWKNILNDLTKRFRKNPQELEKFANSIMQGIEQRGLVQFNDNKAEFTKPELESIAQVFTSGLDLKKGGKKVSATRPIKFPMPNNYLFLLRYYKMTGNQTALDGVNATLENMANGGIFDQIGGGFARYSTDAIWQVPHFEKMLYDNGQLVSLYSEAYQETQNPLYKEIVYATHEYIKREMTNEEGGFYSSLDADSEGVEGKFYVWQKTEIDSLLGEDAAMFNETFTVKPNGNWEHTNVLHITKPIETIAAKYNLSIANFKSKIRANKKILLEARAKRIRPGLDDKILTSWNALMLKGYVDAYRSFQDQTFLNAAIKNATFLKKNALQKDYRLNRNYKDGKSVINAFLDDYALLIDAYVALYQITFDEQWLNDAKGLLEYTLANFYDTKSKMFFYTSKLDDPLITRKMILSDNVIPASNSVMARNLLHLGTYFYEADYIQKSKWMLNNMLDQIKSSEQPSFYSNWCNLYYELTNPLYEVAIIGDDFANLRNQWDQQYLPNVLLLGGKTEGDLELLKGKLRSGQTTIYVCKNKTCKLPVNEVEAAWKLMD